MNTIKYIGLEVHKLITVIAVLNEKGKQIMMTRIKTDAENFRDFFRGLSGDTHVVLEEGGWSAWLYHLIKPLVTRVVVCETRHNKLIGDGNKSDDKDAFALAELLRLNAIKVVYKGDLQQSQIRELFRSYDNLVSDATRAQNRLKAIYRGRGLDCSGVRMLRLDRRAEWLATLSDQAARTRADLLLQQLDTLQALRKQAKANLMAACKQHRDYERLLTLPGFGPIRVASLLAIVGNPHRFRNKRQFWPYCGLAVVTRSSADYIERNGQIVKKPAKAVTRGLNPNHHPQLKAVFKGAAITARQTQEFKDYYDQLIQRGLKPALALVSLARKLAAVTLASWKQEEVYDPKKVFAEA